MKKIIGVILIAIIFIVVFFSINNKRKANDTGITLVKVKKDTIIIKAIPIGQIKPRKEISVKSKIAGIIKKKYVEVGDLVKKGAPLFEIYPDPTPIELIQAKKTVQMCKIEFNTAKKQYDRALELKKKNLISDKEFEDIKNLYETKKLNYEMAKDKLILISKGNISEKNKEVNNIITAPISGTILEILVEEGDPVVPLTSYQPGTNLLSIADMNDLIFKGEVDEIDIGKIKEGMTANIKIGALPNVKVKGIVTKISPKAKKDGNNTTFAIEIDIVDTGGKKLKAGYSANAEVIINQKNDVLIIPERLIHYDEDSTWVEVLVDKATQKIEKRKIKVGISDGMNTEIISGVKLGEEIVERPPKEIS